MPTRLPKEPDDGLAFVAHELRNALAGLRLAVKLLRDPDPAVADDALATVE